MVLHIDSDASYLSVPKAWSRAAGFMYLNGKPKSTTDPNPTHYNGPVHVVCQILRNVMSSTAEAKLVALLDTCKDATAIRTALAEMGWPQPPTPVQTDNSTAVGLVHNTIRQKHSKAIDMRFLLVA